MFFLIPFPRSIADWLPMLLTVGPDSHSNPYVDPAIYINTRPTHTQGLAAYGAKAASVDTKTVTIDPLVR